MRTLSAAARLSMMAAALFLLSSCSVMCHKKTTLRDTQWIAGYNEFVADVGTADVVLTLQFTSGKDFTLTEEFVMPSHPATYVNPDGSVDKIPGHTSRSSSSGTYRDAVKTIVLTRQDSPRMVLVRQGDTFVGEDRYGHTLVFRKKD